MAIKSMIEAAVISYPRFLFDDRRSRDIVPRAFGDVFDRWHRNAVISYPRVSSGGSIGGAEVGQKLSEADEACDVVLKGFGRRNRSTAQRVL